MLPRTDSNGIIESPCLTCWLSPRVFGLWDSERLSYWSPPGRLVKKTIPRWTFHMLTKRVAFFTARPSNLNPTISEHYPFYSPLDPSSLLLLSSILLTILCWIASSNGVWRNVLGDHAPCADHGVLAYGNPAQQRRA